MTDMPRSSEGLALIVELIPGSASNGLLVPYSFGTYNLDMSFGDLIESVLRKEVKSEDERAIKGRVVKEMGGSLVVGSSQVERSESVRPYARSERTEGENGALYLMLPIRVVRSQEGGSNGFAY